MNSDTTTDGGPLKVTVTVESFGSAGKNVVVAEIERSGPLNAATLGLSLAEAKDLLRLAQIQLVRSQLAMHSEGQRACRLCGARRWLKDYRRVCFKSLFGGVEVMVPRLQGCGCDGSTSGVKQVTVAGLCTWVAPELEYVQSRLAADLPYARAAAYLSMLLPVDKGNSTSTLRRRTLGVGKRLEAQLGELDGEVVADGQARSEPLAAMGLDSGYIRDCQPKSARSFEVVVGRILGCDTQSRSLGFVRRVENNEQVRHRIRCRVAQEGSTTDRMTVFTDGDAGLRKLQLDVLPNATHILDWYHLTRHLTVLRNVLHGKDAIARIPLHHHHSLCLGLKSLKWRLWHGQYQRAVRKLTEFVAILGRPTVSAKKVARKLRRLAKKLSDYLKNNKNSLPDYGERYRAGERIATSFVESAVNQLIDKRMSKSQQMRWSHSGAHLLLQVRAEAVDGRLVGNFQRWFPGFRSGDFTSAAA